VLTILNRATSREFLVDTVNNCIFAINFSDSCFIDTHPELFQDSTEPVTITVPDLKSIKKFRKALSYGHYKGFTGPQVLTALESDYPELFV